MTRQVTSIETSVLIAGEACGPALILDDTLSFWGGYDPEIGKIIDVHHPQFGQFVDGRILCIPRSRGSAGTPSGIAESLRNGSGPIAIVLGERDVNISVGTLVANRLYDLKIPVLEVSFSLIEHIRSGDHLTIDREGVISISR